MCLFFGYIQVEQEVTETMNPGSPVFVSHPQSHPSLSDKKKKKKDKKGAKIAICSTDKTLP